MLEAAQLKEQDELYAGLDSLRDSMQKVIQSTEFTDATHAVHVDFSKKHWQEFWECCNEVGIFVSDTRANLFTGIALADAESKITEMQEAFLTVAKKHLEAAQSSSPWFPHIGPTRN